jgi:hypothetical protein
MADDNPYTYDDESGIMELRLSSRRAGDKFVPRIAIGTLPEAYYVDPAIPDSTLEKYGMAEPYLPASFMGNNGVTELGRIARDAAMEYRGHTPIETLGLDPRFFASGKKPVGFAQGIFAAHVPTQEQVDMYGPGGSREDLAFYDLVKDRREVFTESDRPHLADALDVIYMPRESALYKLVKGRNPDEDDRAEREIAMHEAAHRGFERIRMHGAEKLLKSIPKINIEVGPDAIRYARGFTLKGGEKIPNSYAARAIAEGKFKPEKGTRELDEESLVRLLDLDRIKYIDPFSQYTTHKRSELDNDVVEYFQSQFGRDPYELLRHPKIRAVLTTYQKMAESLMSEEDGLSALDDTKLGFGYEFPPSLLNLPSYEELERIRGSRDFEVPIVDPLGRTDDR